MAPSSKSQRDVDKYINRFSPAVQDISKKLRAIMLETVPDAEEAIKWGMPVYSSNGLLCAIMAAKSHVSFIFYNGEGLTDPDGLLIGRGKQMKHIKFCDVNEIKKTKLAKWIKQAVKLNASPKDN